MEVEEGAEEEGDNFSVESEQQSNAIPRGVGHAAPSMLRLLRLQSGGTASDPTDKPIANPDSILTHLRQQNQQQQQQFTEESTSQIWINMYECNAMLCINGVL